MGDYRKLFWPFFLIAVLVAITYYNCAGADPSDLREGATLDEKKAEEKHKPFECPKTHISNQDKCFSCHIIPSFAVRESKQNAEFDFPNRSTSFKLCNGKRIGYYYLTAISENEVREAADYFMCHKIDRVLIDIHSPGGSLFDAWRIKGIIDEMIFNGIHVETQVYGAAFSAGFLIFCAGQERIVSETASLMWHELITGEMFAIKTPADKEDEAKVLRLLQDTANNWIATRGKVPKDELDSKIRKKEFWIDGKEAHRMGFATKLIGEKSK